MLGIRDYRHQMESWLRKNTVMLGNVRVFWPDSNSPVVIGPHWAGMMVTVSLLRGGTHLNWVVLDQCMGRLTLSVSLGLLLKYAFCPVLLCTCLYFFYRTGCKDPGFVVLRTRRRQLHQEKGALNERPESDEDFAEDEERDEKGEKLDSWEVGSRKFRNRMRKIKFYCQKCDYQINGLRTVEHCNSCDLCILGSDHHCPWMGQCIGKNNFNDFVKFNVCWLIYAAELIIVTVLG